jgi:Cdc6-like AAA superfamily ATPase
MEHEFVDNKKTVYEAFDYFKKRFLIDKKSIFSASDDVIFTISNIQYVLEKFVKNPNEDSGSDFDEKIKTQLENSSNQINIVFAHAIWLWAIFANDMKRDGKINGVMKWISARDNDLMFPDSGCGNTGQYHKTNKPAELAYIFSFFEACLNKNESESYEQVIKKLGKTQKMGKSNGKVTMYNILLHLLNPEYYERIASYGQKEKVVSFFESIFDDLNFNTDDVDDKIKDVRDRCELDDRFSKNTIQLDGQDRFDFYGPLQSLWDNEIVLESKNMILHGAPGTGKTYSVENSIKNRLEVISAGNANSQFTMVQFHPSYGYEDFIDGIKPAGIDSNGNLKFELINGAFKQMCITAFAELNRVKDTKEKAKIFYFIADEINRAELSRVFGELLLCIEEDKRLRFEKGKLLGTKVKTQNTNMWKKEHAVVVLNKLDDIGNNVEDFYFGVPTNLYFIGTMNDIDRSVDSFDMALRRRFFWKHYECNYDVVAEKYEDESDLESYSLNCRNLNQHIVSENGFNLGESYQLGHSYFLNPKKLNSQHIKKAWDNNIAPLLKEYLRSEYKENDIKKHLDVAKNIFLGKLSA